MGKLTFESLPAAVESLANNQARILDGMGEIKKYLRELDKPYDDDLPIDINKAARVIGRAKGTIYNKIASHSIPHHKKDGSLYFFKSELLEWLKTGKVETDEELEEGRDERLNEIFHNRKKR